MASSSKLSQESAHSLMGFTPVDKYIMCALAIKEIYQVCVSHPMMFNPVSGQTLYLLYFDIRGFQNHIWSTGNFLDGK